MGSRTEEIKLINKLAIPSLAGSLAETIFGIADQAIIGRTSIDGYAAVGVASNIIYVLTGTMGILSMAFTIMFSKAVGEENKDKAQNIFNSVGTLALIIGILFELAVIFGGKFFFAKFYHFNGQTLIYAYDYIKIAGVGLGMNMLLFIFSAYFKNLQKPMIYLYGTIFSLVVNFILDYILVFGKFGLPSLGVKGAAIGTVAGLACHLAVYVIAFVQESYIQYKIRIDKQELLELVKLYVPLLGQDFVESTLFVMIITSFVTGMGVYYAAAYNLIESIVAFAFMPVYAYSGATLMLVGQSYSKKEFVKLQRFPKISIKCCIGIFLTIAILFSFFSESVCGIITNDTTLIEFTKRILPVALGMQIFNIGNQIFKYCLQGVEREKWVFIYSTGISCVSCIIIYYFTTYTNLQLYGTYVGLGITYFLLGIGSYLKYRKVIKVYKK